MRIALCDDEIAENENLYSLLTEFAVKQNLDFEISTFTRGKDLVAEERFDLYFLDFIMGEMDGIAVAKALKEKFNSVTICFLTNYETAAAEVINNQIYADGFLTKPVDRDLLFEKLEVFYKKSSARRLNLKKNRAFHTVFTDDIYYIEASGKKSIINFRETSEEFPYLISEICKILDENPAFCRIHRAFVVNMAHIVSYDAKTVRLKNGKTLPLKMKEFPAVYNSFIFD